MRSIIVMNGSRHRLISYGNGLAYRLEDMKGRRSVFLQGDDAHQFRDELETLENLRPDDGADDILGWMWDHHDYGAASTEME
jgi:hypothetical protein